MVRLTQQKMIQIVLLITLFLLLLSTAGCRSPHPVESEITWDIAGSSVMLKAISMDHHLHEKAFDDVYERITEIDNRVSLLKPDSLINQLNAVAGHGSIALPDDVRFLIEEGLAYYQTSEGYYHIGLGSITRLWGLHNSTMQIPPSGVVDEVLSDIDIGSILISGNNAMIQQPGTLIDLGNIARGYAIDEAVRIFRDNGIRSGIIHYDGDVFVMDEKPDNQSWYVGIKEPLPGVDDIIGRFHLTNRAIVTAGDYIVWIEDEASGRRYHHIMHPDTGYPVDNKLASVTVTFPTALDASMLATTAFIMGLEEGYDFVVNMPNAQGLFITKEGEIYLTPGTDNYFELLSDEYRITEIISSER